MRCSPIFGVSNHYTRRSTTRGLMYFYQWGMFIPNSTSVNKSLVRFQPRIFLLCVICKKARVNSSCRYKKNTISLPRKHCPRHYLCCIFDLQGIILIMFVRRNRQTFRKVLSRNCIVYGWVFFSEPPCGLYVFNTLWIIKKYIFISVITCPDVVQTE